MTESARHRVLRLAALLLYVLASTTVGFAHRAVRPALPPEVALFALPDGTVPALCTHGPSDGHDQGEDHAPVCAACCLTAAPGLLTPAFLIHPRRAVVARMTWLPRQDRMLTHRPSATLGARGPPAI